MIGALLYLQWWTTCNRLAAQVRRLKKPKYLVGFLVGGAYFFFYLIRPILIGPVGRHRQAATMPAWPAELSGTLEWIGAAVLLVVVLAAWFFPHARAALNFSEAEAAFFFPAPVHRRTLIHFKLLRSQARILFTTLIFAFVSNRFGQSGGAWIHLAGWWLILSTLSLHFLGASFARTRLLDWGVGNWTRRFVLLALVFLAGGACWWWLTRHLVAPTAAEARDPSTLMRYVRSVLEAPPLGGVLQPFRWTIRPFLATSAGEFARVAWPAVVILALHYIWVIRSDVAFEEASLEQARQRTERISAARSKSAKATSTRARRAPFTLRPTGPPAVALLWKNLIGAGAFYNLRLLLMLIIVFGLSASIALFNTSRAELPNLFGFFSIIAFGWAVLLGPQLFQQDFRHDLRSAELLKLYPLAPWKIVLGELLAPAVILTFIQWGILLVAAILVTQSPLGRPILAIERISVALGTAFLCPAINLVSLLIPNAGVLMFPAWLQVGPGGPQGIEATGQRLIFFLGQLLVFSIALLAPAVVTLGVYFVLVTWLSWVWVLPLAGLAGAIVLLLESSLGIYLLGLLFEKLDVAAELRL